MSGAKAAAAAKRALALSLAGTLGACGMWHENIYPHVNTLVVIPPAPPPIDAPPDMPAFDHAPLTPQALMAHTQRLASDQFQGRAPGTHGEALTVDYIERAFHAAGLQPGVPVGVNAWSWDQVVPMTTSTILNTPALAITEPLPTPLPGQTLAQTPIPLQIQAHTYQYGEDFVVWTKTGQPHLSLDNLPLVFVGYGIVDRELGWDDYAGIDMTGKIALILSNDPDGETGDDRGFQGRALSHAGFWQYKMQEAARHGAAGALIIHEAGSSGMSWDVVRETWTGPQRDLARATPGQGLPPVEGWISEAAARDLLTRAGQDFGQQKVRAQRPDFTPVSLNLNAALTLDTQTEASTSRNVIGILPGKGHPNEAVIYSAHWDHLGPCPAVDGDDICNGAVDNATGVAGLIELARRFAGEPRRTRTVVFIAFTGKESGLLGSEYYVEHPIYSLSRTAALINLEGLSTLGAAQDIGLVGGGQNDLDDMLTQAAADQGRQVSPALYPERGAFFTSDQYNFARLGVPVLVTSPGLDLFGGGITRGRALWEVFLTQRDHKPADQFSPTWDMTAAFRDLQLLYTVGGRVADGNDWPAWRANSAYAGIRGRNRD